MENINKLITNCIEVHKATDCYLSEIEFNQNEIKECENEILTDKNFIKQYGDYGVDIIGDYIESFLSFNKNFYYDTDCKWYRVEQ